MAGRTKERDSAVGMDESIDPVVDLPGHVPSRGRAYLYVLPCRNDSLLKLGFSRDPLSRLETLHPRYYEFFDLEAAFLVETDRVSDARRLESRLGKSLDLHSAPAPLVVPRSAAGHTEWYRGALDELTEQGFRLSEQGYFVHKPATAWLRSRLLERAGQLFAWSANLHATLTAVQGLDTAQQRSHPLLWPLRHALDAYGALDLSAERWISPAVWEWYQQHRRDVPAG